MAGLLMSALLAAIGMVGISMAQEWRIEEVAEGTKPELAVDESGRPHIAFMTEAQDGGVFHAVRAADGWATEQVAAGYFYGPLDLAVDAQARPHIAYHDHQAPSFNPQLGDASYAFKNGDEWIVETISHVGHDGWDTSIAVAPTGDVHVASIDPAQFGSQAGVEWALRPAGGGWEVQAIGSGPVPYEFGTGLALNRAGAPLIVYHDGSDQRNTGSTGSDLYLAADNGTGWDTEIVDSDGDVGKFASLAIDSQNRVHIAYLEWTEENAGFVRYAVRDGTNWSSERVADLESLQIAFLGARRMISIAIDVRDRPHLAYADRRTLQYARHDGRGWAIDLVAEPRGDDTVLGQLASLDLAADGRPHIAYYELPANARSSTGTVLYAVGAAPTAVSETAVVPERFELAPNRPNPFNPTTELGFTLPEPTQMRLAVYNLLGQEVRVLQTGLLDAGSHRVTWDGLDARGNEVATGVYLALLRAGSRSQVRKMLLLR